ncbi:MAG: hypothetical protein NTY86_18450 [Deltaproteobacteria bacterium]|nr:hypothetical protein [Deltaproteobacteria bacterium]
MVAKMKKHTAEAGEGLSKKTEEPQAAVGGPEAELAGETAKAEDLTVKLEEAEKKAADNYDKYVRTVAELDTAPGHPAAGRRDGPRPGTCLQF